MLHTLTTAIFEYNSFGLPALVATFIQVDFWSKRRLVLDSGLLPNLVHIICQRKERSEQSTTFLVRPELPWWVVESI